METGMVLVWLNAVFQCVLSVCVIGVSIRLCIPRVGGPGGRRGSWRSRCSVAFCLRQCLGWVSTVGNAVSVPITVLLNLRTPQCLYTCITLVCCPLLVRQFKMFLMLLLTLNAHLQHRLGDRYTALVTRPRVLCLVLLSWLVSVVSSFAQFIVWNAQDSWGSSDGSGSIELGLGRPQGGNWSTPFPPPPKLPYPQDRSVIGKYLPYGGFLSKFLITYTQNFTYAEIHGSHWGVCAADTVLSPAYMVYVYAVTVFLVPMLVLLAVYLDLMCVAPRLDPGLDQALGKSMLAHSRSVALSISLLVLLCLPMHVSHALLLFAPGRKRPPWAMLVVSLLFQSYGLVPPLLFKEKKGEEGAPSSVMVAPAGVATTLSPQGKAVRRAFCVALQKCSSCCSHSPSPKAKVCPEM